MKNDTVDYFTDETIKIIDTVREQKYWNDNLASVLLCKITMMNFRILYIIFPNDFLINLNIGNSTIMTSLIFWKQKRV
jgi:hypothetical protein